MKSVILLTFQLTILLSSNAALGLRIGNSCGSVVCEAGTRCVLVDVQCFTTPCDPIPQCQPSIDVAATGCESMVCGEGEVCVMNQVACFRAPCPALPQCAPAAPAPSGNTCANVRCAGGPCVMERDCPTCPSKPRCKPAPMI